MPETLTIDDVQSIQLLDEARAKMLEVLHPRRQTRKTPTATLLSVVIPAYNEEKRIPSTLRSVIDYVSERDYPAELVIVDDGSTDGTVDVCREIVSERLPLNLIRCSKNLGKGNAIRAGMLEAKGEYVLFMDADMSTPIEELDRLLAEFGANSDVVIGSRKIRGSKIEVRQPWFRELLGKAFSILSRLMTVWSIGDFTCGFKCFRKSCIAPIFSRQRLNGWGYDTEILFVAHKLGYRVKEVPVSWADSADTKVRLWRDVVGSAMDLLRIRMNSLLGRYK